jgi:hypothetical protein
MLRSMSNPEPPAPLRRSRSDLLVLLVLLVVSAAALLVSGCEDEIGDSCEFNVDCSPQGDRLCDLSSPGGYCTIENCTAEACPEEARCIAFYPVDFLIQPCFPETEDDPDPALRTNDCTPDQKCISSGFCASRASARRYCMRKCDEDSDCRDEYECRRTGLSGAEWVPPLESTNPDQTKRFCAPKG